MKIINFKSKPKNNFFSPEWNYFIAENFIKNVNFDNLSTFLLNQENKILNLPITKNKNKVFDGSTGLGEKSTTSRSKEYNVLFWDNTEINLIKNNILECHNLFLKFLNLPLPNELYIQCWVNIMRKGEQIKPHIHGVHPDTYLGGHICVQVQNTSTFYINPINQIQEPEIYSSKNEIGKITLFQNNIPHYTDMHNSEKERITLAFDLRVKIYNNENNHYLKLI
jgi:hypothetical protein